MSTMWCCCCKSEVNSQKDGPLPPQKDGPLPPRVEKARLRCCRHRQCRPEVYYVRGSRVPVESLRGVSPRRDSRFLYQQPAHAAPEVIGNPSLMFLLHWQALPPLSRLAVMQRAVRRHNPMLLPILTEASTREEGGDVRVGGPAHGHRPTPTPSPPLPARREAGGEGGVREGVESLSTSRAPSPVRGGRPAPPAHSVSKAAPFCPQHGAQPLSAGQSGKRHSC